MTRGVRLLAEDVAEDTADSRVGSFLSSPAERVGQLDRVLMACGRLASSSSLRRSKAVMACRSGKRRNGRSGKPGMSRACRYDRLPPSRASRSAASPDIVDAVGMALHVLLQLGLRA